MDNLKAIVRYCENVTDCRRAIQLAYFGEVFDPINCRKTETACDNCRSRGHQKENVTDYARRIVAAVDRLSKRTRYDQRNFTVNHLVDIIRGSKNKKVLSSEWDKDEVYNSASSVGLSLQDSSRIVRQLVMEQFLQEELKVNRDGMASAYVRVGSKASTLLTGQATVTMDVRKSSAKRSSGSGEFASQDSDEGLQILEEDCMNDLKSAVGSCADVKSVFLAIPAECFQEIARKLPRTKEELMDIDQMTAQRFHNYGELMLEVCRNYYQKRQEYLKNRAFEEQQQRESDQDANVKSRTSSSR